MNTTTPVPLPSRLTRKAMQDLLHEILAVAQKHALAVDDFIKTFNAEVKSRTLKENYQLINSTRAQHVAPLRSFLWIHGTTQQCFDKIEKHHRHNQELIEQIRHCNRELRALFDSTCGKIEPLYEKIDTRKVQ